MKLLRSRLLRRGRGAWKRTLHLASQSVRQSLLPTLRETRYLHPQRKRCWLFQHQFVNSQILTKDALDYDTTGTYNVVVAVHDGKDAEGNASTTTDASIGVVITLTDINEPPTVTGTTTTEYAENDTRSGESTCMTTRRNESTWSLTGADEDDFTITQHGELKFSSSPDYEAPTDSNTNNEYLVNVLWQTVPAPRRIRSLSP